MDNASKISVLLELLSTSSSSEEDENEILLLHICNSIPKIENYIKNVIHGMSDKQFKERFRLNRTTVYEIINDYEQSQPYLTDNTHGGSTPISAETQILSFICFSCNKCTLRDVSEKFDIGLSTLFRHIDRVVNYLLNYGKNIIKMAETEEEKENLSREFQKISGFPNVIGCIDGSYINIRTPAHKIKSTYTNRHDLTSVTLQAICDHKNRFLDVFTGVPGKIHDARVLALSNIKEKLPYICEKKYHILGDGACAIRPWLLIPYRETTNLNCSQINYNKKFCATRVKIENTFGIFKGCFRQLIRLDMHKIKKISKYILALCVLHNLCIEGNDFINDEDYIQDENINWESEREDDIISRSAGEAKRNTIKDSLFLFE